jgi:hypothetical protein
VKKLQTASSRAARPARTASQRSQRARIAAYHMHSRNDGRTITANARKAFMGRFCAIVDPHNELPEAERTRRATAARSAYFAALALKSSVARSRRRGAAR